ncbi:hypothetical protein BD414DRAFT_494490 [Trametes punicea]|nr:hypothetical protein BD414DRAFT_494490 [Trametes punicea]
MNYRNPLYYEGAQHLLEKDPITGGYTEGALKAQTTRMRRLIANRPPRDSLGPHEFRTKGRRPPLYNYGFPLRVEDAIAYARRHALKVEIVEEEKELFGGKDVFDFGEVPEEWCDEDSENYSFVQSTAIELMLQDLSKKSGMLLYMSAPFTLDYHLVLTLWTNYDADYSLIQRAKNVKGIQTIKEAMNEVEGRPECKAQWWFCITNGVSMLSAIE